MKYNYVNASQKRKNLRFRPSNRNFTAVQYPFSFDLKMGDELMMKMVETKQLHSTMMFV